MAMIAVDHVLTYPNTEDNMTRIFKCIANGYAVCDKGDSLFIEDGTVTDSEGNQLNVEAEAMMTCGDFIEETNKPADPTPTGKDENLFKNEKITPKELLAEDIPIGVELDKRFCLIQSIGHSFATEEEAAKVAQAGSETVYIAELKALVEVKKQVNYVPLKE